MLEVEEVVLGAHGTALRVKRAEIDVADVGLDDGSGAHVAGLECDVEIAAEDMPCGEFPACLGDAGHLGMQGRILLGLTEIMGSSDDFSVFDDDTADR